MVQADVLTAADVVVVGAGIVGLCTAWELRNKGFSVAVVEQRFPGYGASSRNPGMIWLQTRRAGVELELSRAGKDKYEEYKDALGEVFDYRSDGGLMFFETEAQGAVVEEFVRARVDAGLDIRLLGRDEAAELSPIVPETAIGAAFCTEDAQIDPLGFLTALDGACLRRGIRLFRNTAVLSTLRDRDRVVGVRTVRGEIRADGVVWATGAWSRTLRDEGVWAPVESARLGQMMLQPVETGRSPILHGPRGVASCGALTDLPSFDPEIFAAPTAIDYDDTIGLNHGGSLYIGHSSDGRGSLNPHISLAATQAMVAVAMSRYRGYAAMGVTGLWAGLHSSTADHLPIVDQVDGVYLNFGHEWGVASGPAAGAAVAEIMTGGKNPFPLEADRSTLDGGATEL